MEEITEDTPGTALDHALAVILEQKEVIAKLKQQMKYLLEWRLPHLEQLIEECVVQIDWSEKRD